MSALALAGGWTAFLVMIIRGLLKKYLDGVADRFDRLEKSIELESNKRDGLDRDFRRHLAELPTLYVQREDWVRFSTVVETKMDRLFELVQASLRGGKSE